MFSLHLNNTEVYLPESFDFGIVLESPLFNQRGTYSYPFTVPYNPNKHIFGHIKELAAAEPELPLPFEIKWGGITQLAGEVSKFKYADGNIELELIGAKSLFHAKFTGQYLDEIDMGSEDYTNMTATEVQAQWANSCRPNNRYDPNFPDYSEFPYNFAPRYCEKFHHSDALSSYPKFTVSPIVNKWDPRPEVDSLVVYDNDDEEMPFRSVLCMNLYLQYVLEKIIEASGYKINKNDLDNFGEGMFNLSQLDFPRIFIISWINLQPAWLAGKVMEFRHTLPHYDVNTLFDDLEDWIGLKIVADDIDKTVDLILFTKALADDRIETGLNRSVSAKGPERETFIPAGITLQYPMSGDEFKGNTTLINPDAAIYAVNTYADLPAAADYEGAIIKVNYPNRYMQWTLLTPPVAYDPAEPETPAAPATYEWKTVGEFAPLTVGEDPEEREFNIKLPVTDIFPTYVTNLYGTLLADLELPFSSESLGIDYPNLIAGLSTKTDSGISVLIFKGMRTHDENGFINTFDYPFSNYSAFPITGNQSTGWLSLKLQGGWALYNTFHKVPLQWETTQKRPVSFYIDAPPGAIFSLDFLTKYQFANLSFHINKIHLNFTRKEISSVRLECYYASGGIAELPQNYLLIDEENYLLIDEVNKLLID